MRRAGYDVRVLPEEDLGWEENPPTLIEFIRRDQRWCQGTLQYVLLHRPAGPEARQPLPARLRHADVPRLAGLDRPAGGRHGDARRRTPAPATSSTPTSGIALLAIILTMWFAPKIATVIDVLTRPKLRRGFGGTLRFLASVVAETIFFLLLSPIMWVCHTLFLAGLPFGRVIGWIGQVRDDHSVPWSPALRKLWPHTRSALACLGLIAADPPGGLAVRLLPARRRPRAVDPALRLHRAAGRRPRAAAHRHRPPAGGNRRPPPTRARAARGRAAARPARHADDVAHRARRHAIAAHLLRPTQRGRARDGPALRAVRRTPAIWCSTSARMSATASPRSAGSARASSRSSRSPRCVGPCGCSTAATAASRSSRSRSAARPATAELMINTDNPTDLDRVRRLHRGAADGAPAGRASPGTAVDQRAHDDARRADRARMACRPSSRSMSRASRRRRWPA